MQLRNGPFAGVWEIPGGRLQSGLAVPDTHKSGAAYFDLGGAHREVMGWSSEDVWL